MKSQSQLIDDRYVSIWVGEFTTERDLDNYCQDRFALDFGFQQDYSTTIEHCFGPSRPLSSVLGGFHRHAEYIDEAIAVGAQKEILSAASALIFHFLKYDEELERDPEKLKPMRFLCSIQV